MQLWKRYLLAGLFFMLYSLVPWYLLSVSNEPADCLCEPPQQAPAAHGVVPCPTQRTPVVSAVTSNKYDYPMKAQRHGDQNEADRQNAAPGFDPRHSGGVNATKPREYSVHRNYIEYLPPEALLHADLAPSFVFYVWCGKRWFEYHNYMSVLSVIKLLRPDNLMFYYDDPPVDDYWIYNTWFKELKESYAFFIPMQLKPEENGCQNFAQPNVDFIYDKLAKYGGLYVNEHTIFNDFPLSFRNFSFIYALDTSKRYSFISTKKNAPIRELIQNPLMKPHRTKHLKCSSVDSFNKNPTDEICITKDTVFFPKDIWLDTTNFGQLIRTHFYGSSDIRQPTPSYDELIPNIAHIVWIGGGEMDFLFFMCVTSLLYVAEVDYVFIHGDLPPSGKYWRRIKDHPRLRTIYREVPQLVFGTRVDVLSHVTDVWRVDFMIKYGGIYVDTDTAFVRPLDREIRGYDAVGTYDWTYWNHPFPDTINFGVAIGKRNAKYWRLFQESMRWFIDSDWSWNGLRQPYRIQERHPELVKIDPRLQVRRSDVRTS